MTYLPYLSLLMLSISVHAGRIAKDEVPSEEMLVFMGDSNEYDTGLEDISSRGPCPKGFYLVMDKHHNRWCVFVGTNLVSWFEAMQICKLVLKDSILLELYDSVLSEGVHTFLNNSAEHGGYRGYWVGGTNILDNSTFEWNLSGHAIDHDLWDKGEPSYTNHAEYCVEFRAWNGKLNDDECHNWRGYLCGKCIH